MNSHMQEIISNGQELVKIVNQGLSSKNLAASTIVMISEMVQTVDGTETMKQIQQILPKIEDSLRSLTEPQDHFLLLCSH